MTKEKINQILNETSYIRVGGSDAEKKCAEYLQSLCAEFGKDAYLEPFEVDMSDMKKAILTADGMEIPCKGYLCSGTHEVEAPFYYLRNTDACSLAVRKNKEVRSHVEAEDWNIFRKSLYTADRRSGKNSCGSRI